MSDLRAALYNRNKFRLLGLDTDHLIKYFFGGNAFVAILVLGAITYSLFREGVGFFPQHLENLTIYRQAGLEYVDLVRNQVEDHTTLQKYLSEMQRKRAAELRKESLSEDQIKERSAAYTEYATAFSATVAPLEELLNKMAPMASEIKEKWAASRDLEIAKQKYLKAGKADLAATMDAALAETRVDLPTEVKHLTDLFPEYQTVVGKVRADIKTLAQASPQIPDSFLQEKALKASKLMTAYVAETQKAEQEMRDWSPLVPIPWWKSFTAFIFGGKWTTQSFWQDWYGLTPLLAGSLLISLTALLVAVPLGVGSAIYVNQLASAREAAFIKPYIEFISAIPSVVLGFFGVVVLAQVMGYFFGSRLNVMNAALLLALTSIPTIFSLTEDAINNVPRHFKEASFALGATRLQTIFKIIVPASLSGLISAVLLGFGRVIGETMVVLLVAGNRIATPDFSAGLGVLFQPVHTMTGLIAQEIPETVKDSLQYRALFMLGIVLFAISLLINYLAQIFVRRFKISEG
jgi:phosphate transport system permease protein